MGFSVADWGTVVTMFRDLVVAIATIFTARVAWRGLNTWRREMRGRTTYGVARDLLRAVFIMREAVRAVRSPLMTPGEFREAREKSGLDAGAHESAAHRQDESAVFALRWGRVADARAKYDAALVEAEAVLGSKVTESSKGLEECIHRLWAQLMMYTMSANEVANGRKPFKAAMSVDCFETIYASDPASDKFDQALTAAVKRIWPAPSFWSR